MTLRSLLSEVNSIVYDSRRAGPGSLFVALTGHAADGHDYVAAAYEKGCRAFLTERKVDLPPDAVVTVCNGESTRAALARVSAEFYGHPSRSMRLIGLTGTKGKTSVSYMLRDILEAAGLRTGLIGTTGAFAAGREWPLVNTTPESLELHRILAEMRDAGVTDIVLEASSWGLFTHRLDGVEFALGVFLNLSPDHIGGAEHPDFEHYANSKRLLFDRCRLALVNIDDPEAARMLGTAAQSKTFGWSETADYRASSLESVKTGGALGVRFCAGGEAVTLPMPGRHNATNALAALACADMLGIERHTAVKALAAARVKGRAECVPVPADFTVMIDYAHNALSTQSLMEMAREYMPSQIITVFGCGGGRAVSRRYDMGRIAAQYSDLCILTSDNPRSERVEDIIADIVEGVNEAGGAYVIVTDRREAIHHALSAAQKDSLVLIIGKGHQCYEEISGVRRPFDEREVVAAYYGVANGT
ncbi:MAG: UDP-N-acetylmuramoyl-L-alanyl-D-glutamate--2,6-diaminopimelate ligase [Oscillospiraceae bacterium]|jgi:UDP-N-acetylmuramoyl-L-alanyl-D-glutamate--2,6-diaminopimelate ligase|nr:UDP-N-acetylmuramoyl-L-alanyl-D-glutamate--2,6-diaminopimelate ligase [Oscillospiraceae bacterium]